MSSKKRQSEAPESSGAKRHRITSPDPSPDPPARDDYTVGWICALAPELTAAQAMLDETYEAPMLPGDRAHDSNVYSYGRMGQHNVVIASLPAGVTGKVSASSTATNLLRSFPKIRFGLMVGIGGGIPDDTETDPNEDIRLGDVVVSVPHGESGGVIQYDHGKIASEGQFVQTGSLKKPPTILLKAVQSIQAIHDRRGSDIPDLIEDMVRKWPRMATKYRRPEAEDRLYKTSYEHPVNTRNCDYCHQNYLVQRPKRDDNKPVIHYGLIGSADQVMRHGPTRDRLRSQKNIICVEMEAAGLMDDFPCLVVRGISDYADSHKSDRWHGYAASVAAGYAKELLSFVPELAGEPTAVEMMPSMTKALNQLRDEMTVTEFEKLREWLNISGDEAIWRGRKNLWQPGTGAWFLQDAAFLEWRGTPRGTLSCFGMPGAGKTILSSIAVEHLRTLCGVGSRPDTRTGVAFLYCRRESRDMMRTNILLMSLLGQLVARLPLPPQSLRRLYERYLNTPLDVEDAFQELTSVLTHFSHVFIVIDALDELETRERRRLMEKIFNLQSLHDVRLLMTYRTDTLLGFEPTSLSIEIRARNVDIAAYLDAEVPNMTSHIKNSPQLQCEIRDHILSRANGMFLLAYLTIGALNSTKTPNKTRDALTAIREGGLQALYNTIVHQLEAQPDGNDKLAKEVLFWIVHAERPLTVNELRHAMAIKPATTSFDDGDCAAREELVSCCVGLTIVEGDEEVIRLVHTTAYDYFQLSAPSRFFEGQHDIPSLCLTYVSYNVFAQGHCETDELYEDRIARYPFYVYAARYWGKHVKTQMMSRQKESSTSSLIADSRMHTNEQVVPWHSVYPVNFGLAIQFLKNDHLVDSAAQALFVSGPEKGYSQLFPERFRGVHVVAWFGIDVLMREILNYMGPELKDDQDRTPLSYAAQCGHDKVVRLLLDRSAVEINAPAKSSLPPLMYAIMSESSNVVRMLLEKGAKTTFACTTRLEGLRTPLSHAAEYNKVEIMKILLEHQACPDLPDTDTYTPLVRAIDRGRLESVRVLLEGGAEVDYLYTFHQRTVTRTRGKNRQRIQARLANNTIVGWDFRDNPDNFMRRMLEVLRLQSEPLGRHSLENEKKDRQADGAKDEDSENQCTDKQATDHAAAEQDFSDNSSDGVPEVLEEQEIKRSPLSRAAEHGYFEIVRTLVEHKASLDLVDEPNETPLSHAIKSRDGPTVSYLLEQDVDCYTPEMRFHALRTAFSERSWHISACKAVPIYQQREILICYDFVILLLLAYDFDLPSGDEYSNDLLILALTYGYDRVVRRLLTEENVDVNFQDHLQNTPLLLALGENYENVVRMLLCKGALPDLRGTVRNISPLFVAIKNEQDALVHLLLEYGADTKNAEGHYLLMKAVDEDQPALVHMVLWNGADPNVVYGDQTPLFRATGKGHEAVVQALLQHGADVDWEARPDKNPIIVAVCFGHTKVFRLLFEKVTNPKCAAINTVLLLAAGEGDEELVRLLLEKGANPNCQSTENIEWEKDFWENEVVAEIVRAGNASPGTVQGLLMVAETVMGCDSAVTDLRVAAMKNPKAIVQLVSDPLTLAVSGGHKGVVELLRGHGARPVYENVIPKLFHAVECDDENKVRLFLLSGVDPNVSNGRYPLLLHAAFMGREAIVELILAAGGAPLTEEQSPALLQAADEGNEMGMKLLLRCGLDINATKDDYTAISRAAAQGHFSLVKLLLEGGAEIEFGSKKNDPLMMAASKGHESVLQLLLSHHADQIAEQDRYLYCLLAVAASSGHPGVVKLLLESGANPKLHDNSIPLMVSAQKGHHIIFELLFKTGGDLEAADRLGRRPLFWAVARGHEAVISFCCFRGANINVHDHYGRTPLMVAATAGNLATVQFLLDRPGIDRGAHDICNRTAQSCAEERGHHAIVQLLQSGAADPMQPAEAGSSTQAVHTEELAVCEVCLQSITGRENCLQCRECGREYLNHHLNTFLMCMHCHELGARCLDNAHIMERTTMDTLRLLSSGSPD
ncbi:hypothetical protein AnigIFM63326_000736 [Aspergillus niger]|nr:hypothetical protein AnigIFM63326_000736 [Aspergillus niger]